MAQPLPPVKAGRDSYCILSLPYKGLTWEIQLFDFFSCKLGPFTSKESPPDWWDAEAQALLRWESSHLDPGCRAGGPTVSAAAHLLSNRTSENAGRLWRWQVEPDLLLLAAARTAMAEPSAWPTYMQCLI